MVWGLIIRPFDRQFKTNPAAAARNTERATHEIRSPIGHNGLIKSWADQAMGRSSDGWTPTLDAPLPVGELRRNDSYREGAGVVGQS